jgi:hypothetical protein
MKSASFYKKKLEDLDIFQTSLTPIQYIMYKPRIEDIRKKVKEQVKLTDTYTPFIQSFEPYILPKEERPQKKSKKEHAQDFYKTYNNAYMQYHGPNIKELDQETINKAKMVKAGEFYNEDGYNKANMYLEQKDVPFYIDDELSNDVGIVLVRKAVSDTGQTIPDSSAFPQEVKIAYRGTQLSNPRDWAVIGNILGNNVQATDEYKQSREQLRDVISKYGDPSELLGYSRGSSIAVNLGEEFGYKTTNFNPFLGTGISNLKSGNHRVIRAEGDIFSFGIAAMSQNENFKVETMPPYDDKINPKEIHSIDNMILNKPRQSEVERQAKILNIRRTARKLADTESLAKINNFRKNRLYNRADYREINHNNESITFNHVKRKVKEIVKSGVSKMKKIKQVGQALRNRFDAPASSIMERQPLLSDDFEDVSLEMDEFPKEAIPEPPKEVVDTIRPEREISTRDYLESITGVVDNEPVMLGVYPDTPAFPEGPVPVPLIEGAPQDPSTLFDFTKEVDGTPLNIDDLQTRMNAVKIDPSSTSQIDDARLNDIMSYTQEPDFNREFSGRRSGDKSFTDYIHSLDAGGTIIDEDGSIKLSGDGFKNQRSLWELSGGDFTDDEQEHFKQYPRETDFDTELTPADINKINAGTIDDHYKLIDDLSLENQEAFMQLHSSNQVEAPNVGEVGYGSRIRSGATNLVTGFLAQQGVDTVLNIVDPEHKKIQEDARQGISGFLGGGLGEMGALRLAGTAVTAEAVLPVAIGAGAGAVAAYETDKWFQNNAPDQVYLRDISDGMVGMGAAGAITGTMLGGPMGGLIGGGIGLATGFLFGSGEYLYQKYF